MKDGTSGAFARLLSLQVQGQDLSAFMPDRVDEFQFELGAVLGWRNDSQTTVRFHIETPSHVRLESARQGMVFGRGVIFTSSFDRGHIERIIRRKFEPLWSDSWDAFKREAAEYGVVSDAEKRERCGISSGRHLP